MQDDGGFFEMGYGRPGQWLVPRLREIQKSARSENSRSRVTQEVFLRSQHPSLTSFASVQNQGFREPFPPVQNPKNPWF